MAFEEHLIVMEKDKALTKKTVPKQLKPWKPGQSGNPSGRPKGARTKLSNDFFEDVLAVWQTQGRAAVEKTASEHPEKFLTVVAGLVPKQVEVDASDAAVDFAKGLHAVAEFLEAFADGEGSADHQGIVPDRPVLSAGSRAKAH